MKVKNLSYPYPVLGNDDDISVGHFTPKLLRKQGRELIRINTTFKVDNPTLKKLVAERKAIFSAELECNSTFFRTQLTTHQNSAEFNLPSNRVRGAVTVDFYIRAVKNIKDYAPEGCHEDYAGETFDIQPGDVLAVGGSTKFIADKEFDPLRPTLRSLINIKKGDFKRGPMQIKYSDEHKIIVYLSEADWEGCSQVKGAGNGLPALVSSIALPVLADALHLVKEKDKEVASSHWYQQLEVILQQQRLSADDPFTAAQQILKNPLEQTLKSLVEISIE